MLDLKRIVLDAKRRVARRFNNGVAWSNEIRPWSMSFRTSLEYHSALTTYSSLFAARRLLESELEQQIFKLPSAVLPGFCWACQKIRAFTYDLMYSDGIHVNWRERLVCPSCQMNNRARLIAQQFERIAKNPIDNVYLTEQVTSLARYIGRHHRCITMSEYLGENFEPGKKNTRGIRHEDITKLSLNDAMFDYVLSFDVLEHVPNYKSALRELFRILRPGGLAIISVPFVGGYEKNLIRSKINSTGEVEHLLPPELHGDPIDPKKGILCYYHFGWELLNDLQDAGFADANLSIYWSLQYGHIGSEQVLLSAKKESAS